MSENISNLINNREIAKELDISAGAAVSYLTNSGEVSGKFLDKSKVSRNASYHIVALANDMYSSTKAFSRIL